ncbi:hypothetical protein AURANDRAFT_65481 [Aureococcus anophagefferens]|uniref:Polyketide synthase-like phosphopantetheine-binding domain-containing protein n=1 Tax=Aureococcus anophagefferens TaxID=44056 RepID=F0YE29_AURAN|nr:hypothetical protein AURANDRAFT_65481 [Aureococcus anophagefferens]EGB06649.1 hypothetical protein AURANDRAFT_65481 [Aureococcus anophagefferens]|eukprot:XP_009038820.1 hypothetical protein AURANDRAFT_65481 [Aureococcus anophagefferens]
MADEETKDGAPAAAPPQSWFDQFAAVAAARPGDLAVVEPVAGVSRTYDALLRRALRLAAGLEARGGGAGSPVAFYGARGADYAALLLACSRLGRVFVPLAPDYPGTRVAAIAAASGAGVVVRDRDAPPPGFDAPDVALGDLDADGWRDASPKGGGAKVHPDDAACPPSSAGGGVILSSSGSTGAPKLIERREHSFQHRLDWTWASLPYADSESCVNKSHCTTTHSLYELLEPLLCPSGRPVLHILPDVGDLGLAAFWDVLKTIRCARLLMVPSLLRGTLDHVGPLPDHVRVVVLMGEAPDRALCRRAVDACPHLARLVSIYGSTEASSSLFLDVAAQLAPQLFARYVGDAAATARKLRDAAGGPLYDCADLAVLEAAAPGDPAGAFVVAGARHRLVHRGRSDDVVKIRGFRIELGDVEHHCVAAARRSGAVVADACAVVVDDALVVFLGCGDTPPPGLGGRARRELDGHVPAYMVPRSVVALRALPLTDRGKRDRAACRAYAAMIDDAVRAEPAAVPAAEAAPCSSGGSKALIVGAILRVTGVRAGGGDRLASVGLDSLNGITLARQLRETFGDDAVADGDVARNPTVQELADLVDARRGGAKTLDAKAVNMEAIAGLRAVLCLWIVRGHLRAYCPAHAWTDGVGYGDMSQFYRTVVFMLLAGMSVSMQHDKVRSSTWNMLKAGAVPLFPVYLVGLAIETPIQLIPCESVTLAWVWWFLVLVMQGGWIVGFREGQLVMTHCWYLTSQIFFLVLFNWFQRSVKARPVGTPMDIARRAAAIQALVFPVRCVTIAMSFFIMHMWPPIQMGTFKIGVIVGQAVLHMELSDAQAESWGRVTDGICLLFLFMAYTWGVFWALTVRFMGEPLLALLVFGLCRTRSRFAKILSYPILADFGQYSYAVYILHAGIIKWAFFVVRNKVHKWGPVFDLKTYRDSHCQIWKDIVDEEVDDWDNFAQEHYCRLYPWMYTGVFTSVVFGAVVVTKLVHQPFQRWWARRVARTTRPPADHDHAAGRTSCGPGGYLGDCEDQSCIPCLGCDSHAANPRTEGEENFLCCSFVLWAMTMGVCVVVLVIVAVAAVFAGDGLPAAREGD